MGLFESLFGLASQGWQQQFSAAEAKKQRDWYERMSNTAHQREVADLRSAGLNPILSTGGQGASTSMPSSPTGSAVGGGSGNMFQDVMSLVNNSAQIDNIKANTELARNQANTQQVDQLEKLQNIEKTKQDMQVQLEYLSQDKSKNKAEIKQIEHNIKVLDASRNNIIKSTQLATQNLKINEGITRFSQKHPVAYGISRFGSATFDSAVKAIGTFAGLAK